MIDIDMNKFNRELLFSFNRTKIYFEPTFVIGIQQLDE